MWHHYRTHFSSDHTSPPHSKLKQLKQFQIWKFHVSLLWLLSTIFFVIPDLCWCQLAKTSSRVSAYCHTNHQTMWYVNEVCERRRENNNEGWQEYCFNFQCKLLMMEFLAVFYLWQCNELKHLCIDLFQNDSPIHNMITSVQSYWCYV